VFGRDKPYSVYSRDPNRTYLHLRKLENTREGMPKKHAGICPVQMISRDFYLYLYSTTSGVGMIF
jgi:hypothetical protein